MFSIAIPLFNKWSHIEETLDSCVNSCRSSGIDYEIVISNNASSDVTPNDLDIFLSKYPNTRAIHLPQTISGPDNWLFALNSCRGNYLKLLLADDPMPLLQINELLEPLDSNIADYIVGKTEPIFKTESFSTNYFDIANSFRSRIRPGLSQAEKMDLLVTHGRIIDSCNPFGDVNALIFHRKCLEALNRDVRSFKPAFTIMPDMDLYMTLFTFYRGIYLEKTIGYFSYHEDSPCVKREKIADYDHDGLKHHEDMQPLYIISSPKYRLLTQHLASQQKERFLERINEITRSNLGIPFNATSNSSKLHFKSYIAKLRTTKALLLGWARDRLTSVNVSI
jgi:glycosyltransferase involved in cell wall biosynthesis